MMACILDPVEQQSIFAWLSQLFSRFRNAERSTLNDNNYHVCLISDLELGRSPVRSGDKDLQKTGARVIMTLIAL